MSGHMQNSGVKLTNFNIKYLSWQEIKIQLLANFIVECTIKEDKPKHKEPKRQGNMRARNINLEELPKDPDTRIFYIDGSPLNLEEVSPTFSVVQMKNWC